MKASINIFFWNFIRKIKKEEINSFLNPTIKNFLPNPNTLVDMEKATLRTYQAILKRDKIGIFGDYDVDGATSTALLGNYFSELDIIVKKYVTKYKIHSDFKTCFGNNLQYYEPGGGYKVWHNERDEFGSSHDLICSRGLVYMTFLNTVTDGGGTEFYWQNLKINAVKGLTLIWPTDFTHTHRGIVSPTQEKYIATGWYRYL